MTTAAPPQTGVMAEMSERGDTKFMWDKDNADEVKAARKHFDRLTESNKFTAFYAKGRKGKQGEKMKTFDPSAERIILVPQLVGG